MNPLIFIIASVIILFFLWVFFGGENGIKEKFVGLSRFDPRNQEFYKTTNEWGEELENNYQSDIQYTKVVDLTPDIQGKYSPIKSFDNMIKIEDYICENNKKCSKGEMMCKVTLEKIYGVPFRNTRPDFLKNPETNHNLELDCYNEDLKIAVEYNGPQHYKWPNKCHDNIEQFEKQVNHDKLKHEMCLLNGVHLIEVPYNIPLQNIPSFILQNLPDSFDEE